VAVVLSLLLLPPPQAVSTNAASETSKATPTMPLVDPLNTPSYRVGNRLVRALAVPISANAYRSYTMFSALCQTGVMRWLTRSHLHLDRVATPWLIRRFVDPEAEFGFAEWDVEPGSEELDGTWFGVPGVELSSHDEGGTCFHKVLVRFELEEPALAQMDRVVAAGVAAALGTPTPAGQTDFEAATGETLNRLGLGMGVAFDDERHLEAGMALYEAIYAVCQIERLPPTLLEGLAGTMPERVALLRSALGRD
jgi:hypothetical protein